MIDTGHGLESGCESDNASFHCLSMMSGLSSPMISGFSSSSLNSDSYSAKSATGSANSDTFSDGS